MNYFTGRLGRVRLAADGSAEQTTRRVGAGYAIL